MSRQCEKKENCLEYWLIRIQETMSKIKSNPKLEAPKAMTCNLCNRPLLAWSRNNLDYQGILINNYFTVVCLSFLSIKDKHFSCETPEIPKPMDAKLDVLIKEDSETGTVINNAQYYFSTH